MPDLPTHSAKPGFIRSFPLLAFLLIAYNIAALAFKHDFSFTEPKPFHFQLVSGAIWTWGWNEVMLMAGLFILFIEIVKSTRATVQSTMEQVLSMLVFIIFIIEFLVLVPAGTNTFFILGLMSLIDVLAGYAISIAVARKDLNIVG